MTFFVHRSTRQESKGHRRGGTAVEHRVRLQAVSYVLSFLSLNLRSRRTSSEFSSICIWSLRQVANSRSPLAYTSKAQEERAQTPRNTHPTAKNRDPSKAKGPTGCRCFEQVTAHSVDDDEKKCPERGAQHGKHWNEKPYSSMMASTKQGPNVIPRDCESGQRWKYHRSLE